MLNVSVEEYVEKSNIFECSLDTKYKKDNGVFYTHPELSSLILQELLIKDDAIILDPCCGSGSFIYSALSNGCLNVYGADIDGKAINFCKKHLGLKTLKKIDTLGLSGASVLKKLGLKNKVDYIVGNPPYCPIDKEITIDTEEYHFLRNVKDSGSNLFVAALYRAFELAKDDGIIAYIIPKNFLHVHSYSRLRRYILSSKTIVSIIDIGAYFPSVRGEQIILILKNSFNADNVVAIKKFVDDTFVECSEVRQDFYKDEILLFKSSEEFTIYSKLENTYEKFSDICNGYIGRGKSVSSDAITGKEIRKFGFKNHKVPAKGNRVFIQNIYSAEAGIIASFAGNELEATQTVTVFTDGDEKMCRYILGILHSRLCNFYLLKFCYNASKLTMHTDAKYLSRLPLIRKDNVMFDQVVSLVKALETREYMSSIWFEMLESLNGLIYKIFGISDNEIAYIDSEMMAIQSKRWKNDK